MIIEPGPELSPQEVLHAQLTALQQNDHPYTDAGIAVAYDFASPSNKASTGPLERFTAMVKNPLYSPMLNFAEVAYGEMQVMGDRAQQLVIIKTPEGDVARYYFALSKQAEPPCKDWWMTDSVLRVG